MDGWIGVDLDGSLAHYDEFVHALHIGEPIMPMVERVRRWLSDGREVRIMTARVGPPHPNDDVPREDVRAAIEVWCEKHIGQVLSVTNEKDWAMIEI